MWKITILNFLCLWTTGTADTFSVSYNEAANSYAIKNGADKVVASAASAEYENKISVDGWAYLQIRTSETYPDAVQAYAAGYIEGYLMAPIIYDHYRNMYENYCQEKGQEYCNKLRSFITVGRDWMKQKVSSEKDTDPSWYQVGLVFKQLDGMTDGYNAASAKALTHYDITLMNMMGDLFALEVALGAKTTEETDALGHCSVLIKLLPGNVDLYASHVSWFSYSSMLRVQKRYDFSYHISPKQGSEMIPGRSMSFSSYPAAVFSMDDFYSISTGLFVTETTIGNFNKYLWKNMTGTGEIFEWIRVISANRLATDGESWGTIFSRYNSGTYNNQWMVLNYNKFKIGQPVRKGLLWVLEQSPGLIKSSDLTSVLKKNSYWASYNVPYFEEIYNRTGWPQKREKLGDFFTHDNAPRAQIFRRDHKKVKDLPSMLKLMRYNDYLHDPLSICENCNPKRNPWYAISARGDLIPKNATVPFADLDVHHWGGTDVKLTNAFMSRNLQFLAINSPTHDDLPPFRWSTSSVRDELLHYGHPDLFMFPIVRHKWAWS